jgi:hypothetical protein
MILRTLFGLTQFKGRKKDSIYFKNAMASAIKQFVVRKVMLHSDVTSSWREK